MPNPNNYTNKENFMSDCLRQTINVENKDRDQGIAMCLNMWKNKGKKKKKGNEMPENKIARRVVLSFLEMDAARKELLTFPEKSQRLKHYLQPKQRKFGPPSKTDEPFAKPGEPVQVLEPSGKWKVKPYDPRKMKEQQVKPVEEKVHG